MAEAKKACLHGMWASPYGKRVEVALRIKGIEFDYVEEDLINKSQFLLQNNPVYKKVPIFVHNGKSMVESLVILEYIDETWKDGPKLLPEDPYERAAVKFWANFLQQIFDTITLAIISEGQNLERAVEQVHEKLKLLEDGLKGCYPGGFPSIAGCERKGIWLLDIVMWSIFGMMQEAIEHVLGVKFIDNEKYPLVSSWVKSLSEVPLMKELLPPREMFVGFLQYFRAKGLEIQASIIM